MRKLGVGPNFTIFVLFFGLALWEAVRHGAWGRVVLFALLGLLFLRFSGASPVWPEVRE